MKILYAGKTIRIINKDGSYFTILPKRDFDKLIKSGLTRKKAKTLNIGPRLYNNSYNYHYAPTDIEKQRIDKIKTTNSINRYDQWEEGLLKLETISPGITLLFKNNLRNNPELINIELERLNDIFHEMRLFVRQSKKYIRQACIRKGVKPLKLVANTSEYKLKVILKELGLIYEVQPYIEKKWFDFRVGKTMIELDGENYHTQEKDLIKENLAYKHGYKVLRINTKELNDFDKLKNKIIECL